MAEKSEGALALLDGMAEELAGVVRKHMDALKEAPVASDPAVIDRTVKAAITLARACLMVRQVQAAEDKIDADKQRRITQLEQMDMNDITPEELERRAAELRAKADHIVALVEAKCGPGRVFDGQPALEHPKLDGARPRRAA